jgi:hypothetical protein
MNVAELGTGSTLDRPHLESVAPVEREQLGEHAAHSALAHALEDESADDVAEDVGYTCDGGESQ